MKHTFGKLLFKIIKITGLVTVSLLLLLFLLPYLFPTTISNKIKALVNTSIRGELNFSSARLSFFNHFPTLTLTLYDLTLKGSAPFQKETLIASREVAFGLDLNTLFAKKININEIFLTNAFINVQVDEKGRANYNVYNSKNNKSVTDTSEGTALKIKKILIENSHLLYNDRSLPMLINAKGFNYTGTGNFSNSVFDLMTHAEIDAVDFTYGSQSYFISKKINADLVTKINTHSLSFLFEKNNLKINQLPVDFTGRFAFLENGYDMDFKINSHPTELKNVFTAMPAAYLSWLQKTQLKGTAVISGQLSGKYIAEKKVQPNLTLSMGIRNGYVAYQKAPSPVTNLFLNLETKMPGLNPDSLQLKIDSIFFNVDKDYFSSIINVKGLKEPEIHIKINTEMDLEKLNKAWGMPSIEAKGKYSLHLSANGKFAKGQNPKSIRPDTIITSIPAFTFTSSFTNGYLKYAAAPLPVKNIHFKLRADCPDHDMHHSTLILDDLNAEVLNDYLKGSFTITGSKNFKVNSDLKLLFHLASIKQVYPLDGMDLKGEIAATIVTNGQYNPGKKLFPKTTANLHFSNGSILTKYYPHPVEKIEVDALVSNKDGSLKTTAVSVKPVSFVFEGRPFEMKMELKNFDNLAYSISSHGTIDVGNVYKVFSKKGLDVKGFIKANMALSGLQSDATKGHYERLFNSGTLEIRNIKINSEYFPYPFYITKGEFSFKQDKIWFDTFKAKYGKSNFILNGYLTNIINYAIKNEPLTGTFDIKSDQVDINELMAFSGTTNQSSETGVVMIPPNLNISLNAAVKKIKYNDINLTDGKGQMLLQNGKLSLLQTGFTIINAPVTMDATYASIGPKKAIFDYHIQAKDFDIKRAYKEIKLFHDLASAASSAEGTVSLDYMLKGKLNANMRPIYPSLEGGGILSVNKVKMKGFKLFTAVSKETGKNDLNNSDLSKIELKTKIKNNIITIEPFKMRVSGFRPKMQGQVSFDGKLNMKFRLGLPPFGIFGIPMTITGTEEKPVIKLRRGSNNQPLQETAEADDDQK